MFVTRVNVAGLNAKRLDADFYRPEYLELESKLMQKSVCQLGSIGHFFTGPFGSLLPSKLYIVGQFEVISENFAYLDPIVHDELKTSEVRPGDLLVVKASVGEKICKVPDWIPKANITQHIIGVRPNGTFDTDYVSVFLFSKFGVSQLQRCSLGSIIQYLGITDAKSTLIAKTDQSIQAYIGDKVRQADQLRALVERCDEQLDIFLRPYQPTKKAAESLISTVSSELLTDMLTATTYRDHYIDNQKNLRVQCKTVSVFDLLDSVTNGFDDRTDLDVGLAYVKVADVKPGYIDIRNAPKVRLSALTDASVKQIPQSGDLLLTRKGSFGIAAVVMESTDFLCSSEVFCCKPFKKELMPILAWFLNSDAGNMQFWQFSTGTTMPGINQENLAKILIPDFSAVDVVIFNQIYEQRFLAKKSSELLTVAAKFLVEALIEGQIDEDLLITAQEQLQAGNVTIDRGIFARLKTDGLDGQGQPLCADLDQLYALLKQAAED
jgi:type I restriction enzyme, S subunit